MEFPEPLQVEALRGEAVLNVTWNDGHHSAYDFEYLRWRCPCAECQGEGGAPGKLSFTKDLRPEQVALADLSLVGRYAIAPVWQDGHSFGFYSYEYLRAICPCDDCAYASNC